MIDRQPTSTVADRDGPSRPDDRYRSLFESSPDAVLIADGDGRFVDANTAALRLLGYDRDDLFSLAVPDIAVKGAEWAEGEYARLAREGRWRGEMELRRHDGSVVPVEAWVVVLPSPTGPIFASFLRDRPTNGGRRPCVCATPPLRPLPAASSSPTHPCRTTQSSTPTPPSFG
jgi:PAS domain S-box-containing protein